MFEVSAISPLDDWEKWHEVILEISDIKPSFHGFSPKQQDHSWNISSFQDAKELVDKLNKIEEIKAGMKEKTTFYKARKPRK